MGRKLFLRGMSEKFRPWGVFCAAFHYGDDDGGGKNRF
ncbi:hypothetical protein MPNT_230012 [Candidatus Methylacidithermus pantelleriae]|uniref:Uncharacterized protein n=1 Tax=Candidatus Methylacidithermus pantelleriae TaxID=2744239 RepID=A0A8J2BNY5_9BACT|nr:hypothetical protein MPNT_230012 [Candidatus Methylacidithermus pantelleriae]